MDLVNPIVNIVSRVLECSKKHINYYCKLDENLNQLKEKIAQLNALNIDVNNKVIAAEARLMKRTSRVDEWMQRVESRQLEVDRIILERTQHLERRCLNGCCRPKNCWSSYKLGKQVIKKLLDVEELKHDGVFEIVAEYPPLSLTQELPVTSTVGLDSIFDKAWNFLGDNSARIMGLYGMGGVGKTTLMKKIYNELNKRGSSDFDIVIWVLISKEVNMSRVKQDIGKQMGLSLPAASDIFNVLKTKKYLLLLDDIWARIDLSSIGVPSHSPENNSKILFTTRSEIVCGLMEANKKIRVECLSWEASWSLFQEKVGEETLSSDSDIPKLAETVANECRGLPLALITIGRSMASKKTRKEWEHAISVLNSSAAEFPGMGDDVLPLLKFSYDSLPNDTVKLCFLFCSLYPTHYQINIPKLIEQWIGEGNMDRNDNFDKASKKGQYIIGILKSACLLEEDNAPMEVYGDYFGNVVKMHDVLREMALWIACECGREKDKYFVKAGVGLMEAPEARKWPKMAEKISLFGNNITQLENIPECSNLSTLLVSHNERLEHIHNDFFLSMPVLRFLDLSNTGISKVPTSICELFELEFLNLSFSQITSLPYEMRNLTKLKYLSLREIHCKLPRGIISNLLNLEFLELDVCKYGDPKGNYEIDEMGVLNNLKCIKILIDSDTKDVEKFLSYPKFADCARKLSISRCRDITSLAISVSSSTSSDLCLGHLKGLQFLNIELGLNIKELKLSCINKDTIETEGLYETLEIMHLVYLPKLIISWDSRNLEDSARFRKLHRVHLNGCHTMVDLTWLLLIPNLQTIWIQNCESLQEILSSDESGGTYDQNTFSNLKFLRLYELPNLRSICCMSALPFPSLETIYVSYCPELRRLPLDSNSAKNTLKKIEGRVKWWDGLEWENETVKSQFARFFTPYYF
ncbi:hypothetical protein AQUCO_05500002v1 [Aquilegia coerulea]|uniref:Uncharacterized protein n=1 Tax=Aquilegia coerulea TaxID=218851 RepID=A0A2G5CGN1_AQUCA|nr:hypothetical protein AQUCO_05500002v1 [Aquilegia coerulea]